ncbi:MAG: hypothetical protein AB1938_25280, partial [Myxococcota bacterium]
MNTSSRLWLLAAVSAGVLSIIPLASCGQSKDRCSATTCPSGCCDASGVCRAGNEPTACGTSGILCNVCVTGQFCQLGICITAGTGGGGGAGGGSG